MKLGKLLAAGKSIMNGRAEVSYRSSKQIYLPKFGSPKNPFTAELPQSGPRASASGSVTAHSDETRPAIQGSILQPSELASPAEVAETPCLATVPVNRDVAHPVLLDKPVVSPPASQNKSASCPNTSVAQPGKRTSDVVSNPQPVRPGPARRDEGGPMMAAVQTARDRNKFNPFSILRAALPGGKAGRTENAAKGQRGTATQTELSLDSVKVVHNDLSDVDVEIVPIKSRTGEADLPAPKKSWEFVGERLFGVEAT